jgi:hypothetical protein
MQNRMMPFKHFEGCGATFEAESFMLFGRSDFSMII